MKYWLLATLVVALYFLHQDYWFWHSARPLVFGFVPIGLFYHGVYSLAVSVVMWALIRFAWPEHPASETVGTETTGPARNPP